MALTFDFNNENQAVAYEDNFYHVLDNLKFLYERSERRANNLKDACQKLEDENWKDETLQELSKAVEVARENNRRGFPISAAEGNDIQDWINRHIKTRHADVGPRAKIMGEIWEYHFIPTCIGTVGTVQCRWCMRAAMKDAIVNGVFDDKLYKELCDSYDAEYTFSDI